MMTMLCQAAQGNAEMIRQAAEIAKEAAETARQAAETIAGVVWYQDASWWAVILALIAVVCGVWFNWKMLQQSQRELHAAHTPDVRCVLANGTLPWIQVHYEPITQFAIETEAMNDPTTADSPRLVLRNYGGGPTRNVSARWQLKEGVDVKEEERESDCTVCPSALMPGQKAFIWSLPEFLCEAYTREFRATCDMAVEYEDKFGAKTTEVRSFVLRNIPPAGGEKHSTLTMYNEAYFRRLEKHREVSVGANNTCGGIS